MLLTNSSESGDAKLFVNLIGSRLVDKSLELKLVILYESR